MVKNNNKIIIAGPCAIESKKQFNDTIENIYHETDIIRCGAWKARTSPYSFAGRGESSLKWIQNVQKKFNVRCAIEIGTLNHLNLALEYNINTFWIGARTTCNPFTVEEISKKLKNKNVEIWIKNPIFPDIKLWIGAIERFKKNKKNTIKLIHRGFFLENSKKYRNQPRWDLLKIIRQEYPEIPIIHDPSHIAGNRELIYPICKKALEKKVDGLMIEVHNKPDNALSDSKQQLSPIQFKQLLISLGLK